MIQLPVVHASTEELDAARDTVNRSPWLRHQSYVHYDTCHAACRMQRPGGLPCGRTRCSQGCVAWYSLPPAVLPLAHPPANVSSRQEGTSTQARPGEDLIEVRHVTGRTAARLAVDWPDS